MIVHQLPRGRIHEGDWLLADLAPGYDLAIVDGPYAMGIAPWDRMKLDDLAEWYTPHIARLTSLMAPSASVYLWNTAAGLKRLDPVMRAAGWTWRVDIVWDKRAPPSMLGWRTVTAWPDATEVCGLYQRGKPPFQCGPGDSNVWALSIKALSLEQPRTDTKVAHRAREGDVFAPLHPSAKPLAFAERMIRASTRPGGRVIAPFGGTCREAVVCEWMARVEPDEARTYDVCEKNEDEGRDYVGAALAQIRGENTRRATAGQLSMFGGAK